MTNIQIVEIECQRLNIAYTEYDVLYNNLPLKTYTEWRKFGYQVKKGEKAISCLKIWKHVQRKKVQEVQKEESENSTGEEEVVTKGGFKLVKAYFFSREQVEPVKE